MYIRHFEIPIYRPFYIWSLQMLTPTRFRSPECRWALECLWALEWVGIHATKIFKNLDDTNEYFKTTLIPALHLKSFYRFFVDTNFRNFFILSIILRISWKLQQVPDHIECPSCIAHPIYSDIRSRDGYPVISGTRLFRGTAKNRLDGYPTRPEHRVPNLSGTCTPLKISLALNKAFLMRKYLDQFWLPRKRNFVENEEFDLNTSGKYGEAICEFNLHDFFILYSISCCHAV